MFLIVGICNLVIAFHVFVFLIQEITVMANSFISAIPLQPTPECIKLSLLQNYFRACNYFSASILTLPEEVQPGGRSERSHSGSLTSQVAQRRSQGEWCEQSAQLRVYARGLRRVLPNLAEWLNLSNKVTAEKQDKELLFQEKKQAIMKILLSNTEKALIDI